MHYHTLYLGFGYKLIIHLMEIAIDEHIIICSICGRNLIVKDSVNNGVAFLSHLKFDHNIQYKAEQMSETRMKKRDATSAINQQTLAHSE
jgi:hypothetical protein